MTSRASMGWGAVTVGLVVVGLAGYLGFVAVIDEQRPIAAGTLALAAATGFAAFFSPCSFPLLLTFLTRSFEPTRRAALARALRIAVGGLVFLGLVGGAVAVVGDGVGGVLEFDSAGGRTFRAAVGVLLVVFGLRQTGVLRARMRWLDRIAGLVHRHPHTGVSTSARGDVLYGFGYLIAGFG